ncbi:MAG TPA: CoA transferase [Caulobacteraceae bacterium]|jgi:crotonobetainyl-CoA:carnitine CoA-transferase CaiB-like acyl-CoA transferase|nr:CoA transferase [Caulobacteraceae bacterium]
MDSGLLSDLVVIDCASFIAGPAAATILSDFGARVIKIEPPGLGDSYRNLVRLRGDPDMIDYYWTLDSRNKESLAIDLKTPAARAVLETLIRKADVFITNFPFPIRERLRLRAEDIRPLNKRLIYASLTPYGEAGPDRDRTAYDTTAWWARSGLMDMVRATTATEPALSMPGMGDHPTAMAMYAAILTALYRRQATGEGGEVSTSLLANGLWSNSCQIQAALCGIDLVGRGERGQRSALAEYYTTADDRQILLALANPGREWPLLARAVGRPEWLHDPLFANPMARLENAALIVTFLEDIFREHPWAYWRDRLGEAGLTFGIVARTTDHPDDPQIEANNLLPEFEDGFGMKTIDSPFQLAGETKRRPRMAPEIGQHTLRILEECGCSPADIAALTETV